MRKAVNSRYIKYLLFAVMAVCAAKAFVFVNVSADLPKTAYMITGHNEEKPEGFIQNLIGEGYDIKYIDLALKELPQTASLAVIFAPKGDYTAEELANLDRYLSNNGSAYIAFDYSVEGLENLYEYIAEWGILVNDDAAVETNSAYMVNQLGVVLAAYEGTDITKPLEDNNRYVAYYPYSKSLTMLFTENADIRTVPILKTSDGGYTVAAVATRAGETDSEDASIYVSGTTMMYDLFEEMLDSYGVVNYDYARNVLNYLSGNYDSYSISPKYIIKNGFGIDKLCILILLAVFVAAACVIISKKKK